MEPKKNLHGEDDPVFRLIQISIALSQEKDLNKIFELILEEALRFTNADGATIYTVSENGDRLDYQIACNRTLNTFMGGTQGRMIWAPLAMFLPDGEKNQTTMATYVAHNGETLIFEDIYRQKLFDSEGARNFDARNNYHTRAVMALPLKDHEDTVVGVIQMINPMEADGQITVFSDEHVRMVSALASLAAISLSQKKLIHTLEQLFNQFIHIIARAIDRKSLHTSGHLTRVAELSNSLALAVQNHASGPLGDFTFTDDELVEISLAAWMHDFGKIITPQHVLDKSTKLQTVFDRIELVKLRFLLVRQAICTDTLRAVQTGDNAKIAQLQELQGQLDEDERFIEQLNLGSEFVDEAQMERLKGIAAFSYPGCGGPLVLLNEDETENLGIRYGTLLPREVFTIREHATVTREMLSGLTFPKKIRNVPLYASAHHEKINGKGYPLHLSGEQLPLQARLIAIADIYEALTAADRPYKPGKKLSEALTILARGVKDNDIDRDLFEVFLDSGLYLEYARLHCLTEQLDNPDLDKIKGIYRD